MRVLIDSYIDQFNILHHGDPWLDETFQKKFTGLSGEEAFTRPHGLFSIAEEAWHLTVWRRACIRRMNGETVPFDSVENWRAIDSLRETG